MSQLFKTPYPLPKLKEYILKLCEKCEDDDSSHVFSKVSFKRAQMNGLAVEFIADAAPYYHKSKQKYADLAAINYKSMANMLRQLCKYHEIPVDSKIKYNKSSYEIDYFISLVPTQNNETPPNHHLEPETLTDGQTMCTCCGLKYPSQE
jgi:hypothetical protein